MTAVLVVACLLSLTVGFVAGLAVKRAHWLDLGRTAERQVHGWTSAHYLQEPVPRQRRWSQRNVKREPEPAEPQPLRPGFY